MSAGLDLGLALLLLVLAGWVILVRSAFAAVAGFIAYGLLLTLAWLQLRGIDIALTEAAIGGGLTGALLIAAVVQLRTAPPAAPARPALVAVAALAAAALTAVLGICVLALPDPAPTLAPAVAANIAATEVNNAITAVLLSFRSMDTLLEAVVLLFALVGVWSLAPDAAWPGRPGLRQSAAPNGLLAFIARTLPPIGLVIGGYIFWTGADNPGGKFQGATLLAAMWLLVMAAGLSDAPRTGATWLRAALVAGPLVFIAAGVYGIVAGGAFLALPEGQAKSLIIAIELALLPTLTLILALLIPGPPQRRGGQ
ncbi:MAG: hydrogenase subunit MbhD domain-containing protein [Polymorphobacter sp.]